MAKTKLGEAMTPEQKWEELRRHLEEAVLWYCQMQANPKADYFYFCQRENCTKDTLNYMEYLDKPDRKPGEEVNLGELLTMDTKAHYIRIEGKSEEKHD